MSVHNPFAGVTRDSQHTPHRMAATCSRTQKTQTARFIYVLYKIGVHLRLERRELQKNCSLNQIPYLDQAVRPPAFMHPRTIRNTSSPASMMWCVLSVLLMQQLWHRKLRICTLCLRVRNGVEHVLSNICISSSKQLQIHTRGDRHRHEEIMI